MRVTVIGLAMVSLIVGFLIGYLMTMAIICKVQEVKTAPKTVSIITASLYANLFREAGKELGINVAVTGMGSVQAAHQVLLNPSGYSIYASIDPYIITSLLYPSNITSWYIAIASD